MDAREETLTHLNRIWFKLQNLPNAHPTEQGALVIILIFIFMVLTMMVVTCVNYCCCCCCCCCCRRNSKLDNHNI